MAVWIETEYDMICLGDVFISQSCFTGDGKTHAFTCLMYAIYSFQLVTRSTVKANSPTGAHGLESQP